MINEIRERLKQERFVPLSREETAHLLGLVDKMGLTLKASYHALRSYEYGNGSEDLAKEIADKAEAILREIGR